MSRLAIVVQRYGEDVSGGAESLARQIAQRLVRRHQVEVLTTRARDYVTWEDHYPEGEARDGEVLLRRFGVPIPRDLTQFSPVHLAVVRGDRSPATERRFLAEQGPWAPGLIDHLRHHRRDWDAVLFFTALYPTTLLGLPPVAERSVLVPTLHDEPPIHLPAYRRVVPRARFLVYLTPEERDLAARLFDVGGHAHEVAGIGIEPPFHPDVAGVRRRFGLDRPYLLYAGRIDLLKGVPELLRHFLRWAAEDDRADLVLCGREAMRVPEHPRIRNLGFVSDDDRWGLLAGALATVVPSRLESLSIVALESLGVGVPIVVPSDAAVLAGHARRSAGGLLYDDAATFAQVCATLLDRPELVAALGRDGQRFVVRNYSWERVDAVFERALTAVGA